MEQSLGGSQNVTGNRGTPSSSAQVISPQDMTPAPARISPQLQASTIIAHQVNEGASLSSRSVENGGQPSPSSQADSRLDTAPAPARASSQSQTDITCKCRDTEGARSSNTAAIASYNSNYVPLIDEVVEDEDDFVTVFLDSVYQGLAIPLPLQPRFGELSDPHSGVETHPLAPSQPLNVPTGPRSMQAFQRPRLFTRPTAKSPPQELGQEALTIPQFSIYEGKRKAERLPSRSTSPPRSRIKLEGETATDLGVITGHKDEGDSSYIPPVVHSRHGRSNVIIADPRNKKVGWQILCLNEDFGRRKLCGYLGFKDISQMRQWEESEPTRWRYIKGLTLASIDKDRVVITDVLRIICNDGGVAAEILAHLEGLEPWTSFVSSQGLSLNRDEAALLSEISGHSADATLAISMAIIWLIRDSHATQLQPRLHSNYGVVRTDRFPDSGTFTNSSYFWYSPEDVNRAFWYLSNLRYNPNDREQEVKAPAKQVKRGVDTGSASLHNSMSEGEWAGRFQRKDLLTKLKETVDDQDNGMKARLLHLRKWAYRIHTSFAVTDESKLDDFMNAARRYIRAHDNDMNGFREACVDVEIYVWLVSHPLAMEEVAKELLVDFRALLVWLHDHSTTVGNDEGIGGLLNDAVEAIAAAEKAVYHDKKAEIKEMVYLAELIN